MILLVLVGYQLYGCDIGLKASPHWFLPLLLLLLLLLWQGPPYRPGKSLQCWNSNSESNIERIYLSLAWKCRSGTCKQWRIFQSSEFWTCIQSRFWRNLQLLCHGTVTHGLPVTCYGPTPVIVGPVLDSSIVSVVTTAIIASMPVIISYNSDRSGQDKRVVHPQHLFQGGGAWYFRAFDEHSSEYRTFRISRVVSVKETDGELIPWARWGLGNAHKYQYCSTQETSKFKCTLNGSGHCRKLGN